MKSVLIHLEDDEHEELMAVKGKDSWRSLLLAHIMNKDDLSGKPISFKEKREVELE